MAVSSVGLRTKDDCWQGPSEIDSSDRLSGDSVDMSPEGLGTKNDSAGRDHQLFTQPDSTLSLPHAFIGLLLGLFFDREAGSSTRLCNPEHRTYCSNCHSSMSHILPKQNTAFTYSCNCGVKHLGA
jgi:hypothetical protein